MPVYNTRTGGVDRPRVTDKDGRHLPTYSITRITDDEAIIAASLGNYMKEYIDREIDAAIKEHQKKMGNEGREYAIIRCRYVEPMDLSWRDIVTSIKLDITYINLPEEKRDD